MSRVAIAVLSCFVLFGCGGSNSGDDTPSPTPTTYLHIVSSGAAYTEAQETSNSVSGTPENTGYTLDSTGIIITGTFEASSPSYDYFQFNSGTNSNAIVRAFVNGAASASTFKLQCQGYSIAPSVGSASQETKVAVVSGLPCKIIVYPAAAEAGATYTVELIATP
jgi:hypothetical protein